MSRSVFNLPTDRIHMRQSASTSPEIFLIFLVVAFVCVVLFNPSRLFSSGRSFFASISFSDCPTWSLDQYNQSSKQHLCPNEDHIRSTIWTYDSSGVKKYLQWIITRRLASVRFIYLDDHCQIINDTNYHSALRPVPLVLVYFLTFRTDRAACSSKIQRIIDSDGNGIKHIYFTRRSTKALQAFAQIDRAANISANFTEHITFQPLTELVPSEKWTTVYAEDLVAEKLVDCETKLLDLIGKFGLNTTDSHVQASVSFDLHHFISDSVWWDQSSMLRSGCVLPDAKSGDRATKLDRCGGSLSVEALRLCVQRSVFLRRSGRMYRQGGNNELRTSNSCSLTVARPEYGEKCQSDIEDSGSGVGVWGGVREYH